MVASLDDQDEPVSGEKWQWARSSDMETWTDITGSATGNRNPVADDVGSYLRATVTYTDKHGAGQTASAVTDNTVEARTVANAQPSFEDQDDNDTTTGVQADREVNENADVGSAVGKAVSATDADNDILIYSITGGADQAKFSIDSSTGQIKTKIKFNFETGANAADNCAADDDCVVTVQAEDPSGAKATATVNISIEDVNEAPKFTAGDDVLKVLNVEENTTDLRQGADGSTAIGNTPYAANDEDGTETSVTLSREGADAEHFTLSQAGLLAFVDGTSVDYETKSSYSHNHRGRVRHGRPHPEDQAGRNRPCP